MMRINTKNPKPVFALLGAVLSVLVLGCGGADDGTTAPQADSVVDDVVENAIEPLTGEAPDAGGAQPSGDYSVEFIEGAPMPPEFPKDLPLPDGAELVGAFDNELSDAIELSVPGQPTDVLGTMESSYLDKGWDITGAETNGRGEAMILATKDGRSVMTLIEPGSGGKSVVKTIAIEGTLEEE